MIIRTKRWLACKAVANSLRK